MKYISFLLDLMGLVIIAGVLFLIATWPMFVGAGIIGSEHFVLGIVLFFGIFWWTIPCVFALSAWLTSNAAEKIGDRLLKRWGSFE